MTAIEKCDTYVGCAEVLEGGVQGRLDIVGVVCIVPEFGCDEYFGAVDAELGEGLANGWFGSVAADCIRSSVRCLITSTFDCAEFRGHNTHTAAPSICLYPAFSAVSTASL